MTLTRAQLAIAIQEAAQNGTLHLSLRDAAKATYCDAEQERHPLARENVTKFAITLSETADAIQVLSEVVINMGHVDEIVIVP